MAAYQVSPGAADWGIGNIPFGAHEKDKRPAEEAKGKTNGSVSPLVGNHSYTPAIRATAFRATMAKLPDATLAAATESSSLSDVTSTH